MHRVLATCVIVLAIGLGPANADENPIAKSAGGHGHRSATTAEPSPVESGGKHGTIKVDELVAGHLTELNGRYRLRVAEVVYDPGGYIGSHHHVGPGIRCVTAGELTYIQPDKTTVYRAGDCFYETGAVSHTARNATKAPAVLLNFQLLPAAWSAGSAIPPE